jgi:6-phosphogluconate dehydrogenase
LFTHSLSKIHEFQFWSYARTFDKVVVVYATHQNIDKIGFIGLGRMGRPKAINLFSKGFDVTARDIRPEVTQALVQVGLKHGVSIAQIAEDCDIVITMLPSSIEVDIVVQGADDSFVPFSV